MAVIAFVSGRGSPGVSTSTLALALAWPLAAQGHTRAAQRVLVVEADAAGSSATPGYLLGFTDPRFGLASVLADRDGVSARSVIAHSVGIEDDPARPLLVGLPVPHQVGAAAYVGACLAHAVRDLSEHRDTDVLLDLGRVGAAAEPAALREVADVVVLVTRSSLPAISAARNALRFLTSATQPVVGLLVGDLRPYGQAEIAASLTLPIAGVLDWDPQTAATFSDGVPPRPGFCRSRLLRSAAATAGELSAYARYLVRDRTSRKELNHA